MHSPYPWQPGAQILLFEPNLLWSTRLSIGVRAIGLEPHLVHFPAVFPRAQLALIDLSWKELDLEQTVAQLHVWRALVIGHCSHSDKELQARGRAAGCDQIVANGALSMRLGPLLEAAVARKG